MKGYSKIKGKTSFIKRSKSNKEFLFLDKDFDDFSTKSSCKKPHFHEQKPSIIIGDDNDGVEDHVDNNKKKDFFLGRSNDENDDGGYDSHSLKSEGGGERTRGVLWRNLSVSSTTSSYHKNNNNKSSNSNSNKSNSNNMMMNSSLERQSSTRTIHEAVKRAFSRKRSTSVNSDKYSRIHDQPMNGEDDDFENVHDVYNKHINHNHEHDDDDDYVDAVDDDDVGRHNGSLAARSVTMMNKNHHDDHTNNNNINDINNNYNNNHNNNNNSRKHVGSKVMRACKRLFSR